jgi:hypothetical protein
MGILLSGISVPGVKVLMNIPSHGVRVGGMYSRPVLDLVTLTLHNPAYWISVQSNKEYR